MGKLMGILATVVAWLGLGGCDYVAQRELRAGESTATDVRRLMGTPDSIWEEPDGGQVLEYPRGPAGTDTYMVRIDATGRYQGMANVLVPEYFERVRAGMGEDDVRRLLGRPTEIASFPRMQEVVWSWRHSGEHTRAEMFHVHFAPDRKVKRVSRGPDPNEINP